MSFKRKKVNGGIKGLLKRVKKSGVVNVGIIDAGNHGDSGLTVAEVGNYNEFGTTKIPERSFMRSTIREKRKDIIKLQEKLLKKIQSGDMEVEQALGLIGSFIAGEVTQKIVSIKSPPNHPYTIKKKGSSNPLIDTGQLKNSITWEIDK